MARTKKYHFADDQIEAIIEKMNAIQIRSALEHYARRLLTARVYMRNRYGHKPYSGVRGGRKPIEWDARP